VCGYREYKCHLIRLSLITDMYRHCVLLHHWVLLLLHIIKLLTGAGPVASRSQYRHPAHPFNTNAPHNAHPTTVNETSTVCLHACMHQQAVKKLAVQLQ
jgi:hypothetical protein